MADGPRVDAGSEGRTSKRMPEFSWRQAAPVLVVILAIALGVAISRYPVAIPVVLTPIALLLGLNEGLRRPEVLIFSLIAYLSVNDILSQVLTAQGTASIVVGSVKDVMLGLALVSVFFGRQPRTRVPLSVILPILVCFAAAILSARLSTGGAEALYGFRNDFEPLLVLYAAISLAPAISMSHLAVMSAALGQAVAFVAIGTNLLFGLSWLDRLGISGGVLPTAYFVAGSVQPRAFSPLVAPNELGMFSVVLLSLTLASPWSIRWRVLLATAPVAAIWLSQSRSALVGLALMLVLSFALRHRRAERWPFAARLLSTWGLLLLVGLYFVLRLDVVTFPIADPSALGHVASLGESAGLVLAHPLGVGLGLVGPRAIRFTATPTLTESYVLLLTLEAGIPVLIAYVAMVANVTARLARAVQDPRLETAALAGLLALAGTAVNQLVLPSFQDSAVSWILWIVVGIALGQCIYAQRGLLAPVESTSESKEATWSRLRPLQEQGSVRPPV